MMVSYYYDAPPHHIQHHDLQMYVRQNLMYDLWRLYSGDLSRRVPMSYV